MDSLDKLRNHCKKPESEFQKNEAAKRPSPDFEPSSKKRHAPKSSQSEKDNPTSDVKKDVSRQLNNHNRNEKERKAKLNMLILTLKEMVPDCCGKESKNSILEKTCNYLAELKIINQRYQSLLQGQCNEVHAEEIRLKDQKIKELREQGETNYEKLKALNSNTFERWSSKAKSLTNKLRNQANAENYKKICNSKLPNCGSENVDILKSAVMETLPMTPSPLDVAEPVQTTPDSTTNCVADGSNNNVASSLPCIVSSSEIIPLAGSTATCVTSNAANPATSIALNQCSEPAVPSKTVFQKKKSLAKADQIDDTGFTTAINVHSSTANLVNNHAPILPQEQISTTSCAATALGVSSSNSVNVVSQSVFSNVQTLNSAYCSNAFCPPNATGIVSTNNPVIPGIIQSQIPGQNLNCLPTSMLQPQNNALIFGQPPGVLIGQQMMGNQYAVFNQQPIIANPGQIFPQLNQQIAPTVQPFVQPISGTNQSVMPTVGPIGQNLVQVDNKNQFTNCAAILLANGQILPIVTQPSIISTSASQDMSQVSNAISSDTSQSSKTLFLKPCPGVSQTANPTAGRENTSTVTSVNAPISSQQPNLNSPAKIKRPQRVIKPKPSVTDLNTSSSYTITSQELSLSCQMEKLEENDILAKAAESIFSTNVEDLAHEIERTVENPTINISDDPPFGAEIPAVKISDDIVVDEQTKKQGDKRKSESTTDAVKPKQMKISDSWKSTEKMSNSLKDGNIKENTSRKECGDMQKVTNGHSIPKSVVATSSKAQPAGTSETLSRSCNRDVLKPDQRFPDQILDNSSVRKSFETNKTTSCPSVSEASDAKDKCTAVPVTPPSLSTSKMVRHATLNSSKSQNPSPAAKTIKTKNSSPSCKLAEGKCSNKAISTEVPQNIPKSQSVKNSKISSDKKEKPLSKFDSLLAGISSSELDQNKWHSASVPTTTQASNPTDSLPKTTSTEIKHVDHIAKKLNKDFVTITAAASCNVSATPSSPSATIDTDEIVTPPIENLNKQPGDEGCKTAVSSNSGLSLTSAVTNLQSSTSESSSFGTAPVTSSTGLSKTFQCTIASSAATTFVSSTVTLYPDPHYTMSTSINTKNTHTVSAVATSFNSTMYSNNAMSTSAGSSHGNVSSRKVGPNSVFETFADKKGNCIAKPFLTTAVASKEQQSYAVCSKISPSMLSIGKPVQHSEAMKPQLNTQSQSFSQSSSTLTSTVVNAAVTNTVVNVAVTNSVRGSDHVNGITSCKETHHSHMPRKAWKDKPQFFQDQACKSPSRAEIVSDHNLPIMCPPTHSPIATAVPKIKTLDASNSSIPKSSSQSLNNHGASDTNSNKGAGTLFPGISYPVLPSSVPNDQSRQDSQPLRAPISKPQESMATSTFANTSSSQKVVMHTTVPVSNTTLSSSDSIARQVSPHLSDQYSTLPCQPPANTERALDAAFNEVARSTGYSSSTCSFPSDTQTTFTTTSTSNNHHDISSPATQTSSSAFLSISQLTNPPCSISLNELLTSPTMTDIPSAVVNVNNDMNTANSPFNSIANYFSSSPDPHLPIQSSRMFCESSRSSSSVASFSASELINSPTVNKNSGQPICNQNFNGNISQQHIIDNNFDKQEASVFTPFDEGMNNVPTTRPSAAPLPNNNQQPCASSNRQMPMNNQISNTDTNSHANLINQQNQTRVTSHNASLKAGDQIPYLNNFCSVDQHNGTNSMGNQDNSSVSPMVNFHDNVSHPVQSVNHSVSPGKRSMHSAAPNHSNHKIHANISVSQGKNQNNMSKVQQMKENMHNRPTSMNYGAIWQPSGDLQQNSHNFHQPTMAPQAMPSMKQSKQVSSKESPTFPCRNWSHDDDLFSNSMGYQISQSRSPSNYRPSSVSLPSPRSTVSPSTSQSTVVRQSPIADMNKLNQSPKASAPYPSAGGNTQDQNRSYSGHPHKSSYCFNSGYVRGSNSSLSSTYSAEALIGENSRSCNQNFQASQPFSIASKVIPHSAESLLSTTSSSANSSTNMSPATFNFQSINPVVSSHSNSTSNHFPPSLGLIPRPRFPGFPVPGHNNHVMNSAGTKNSNVPVEDGIAFRWPPPRLPPPPPISVAASYQTNSLRMNSPAANKSPHLNSVNKSKSQKPSSQSLPAVSNHYQFQNYNNQTNQPATVTNAPSSSKSRSRNAAGKNSKSKNPPNSKKAKQSASLSTAFPSSSSLEEINLSGSIFEPNRSITPYFGLSNFSPPRSDAPTYLPNNINTPHRSNDHNSSTVSSSMCNTFSSSLFPPRCQSNLNLNFQQSGSFGVNTIHHHAVPNQMPTTPASTASNSITSQFNVSNLIPDINNSTPSVCSSNLGPIKFHHGNHIAPPPSGTQPTSDPLSHNQAGSSAHQMYNSRTHPPLLHNGMSINSILGGVPDNMHHNNRCSGGPAYDSRQPTNHVQIGPIAPSLVHPPPSGHSGSFNNVLSTLNFSVDDH